MKTGKSGGEGALERVEKDIAELRRIVAAAAQKQESVCPDCHGSGVEEGQSYTVWGGRNNLSRVARKALCPTCGGTGRCPTCSGAGRI